MRISWFIVIPVLWCAVCAGLLDSPAQPGELSPLVRAYRQSPTPEARDAVEAFAAAHPEQAALAHLGLGVAEYTQQDYVAAIADLERAETPKIADYAAYYLAAARAESGSAAGVADQAAAVRSAAPASPLAAKSWLLEARALRNAQPEEAVRFLREHYRALPQPEGDLALGDAYFAAGDLPRAIESYQRVNAGHLTGDAATHAAAMLTSLAAKMGDAFPAPPPEQAMRRADLLLRSGQYTAAKAEYEALLPRLAGVARERAEVRIAAAELGAGRASAALAKLRGLDLRAPEADAERLYYEEEAARRMTNDAAMMAAVRALGDKYPRSEWRLKAITGAANRWLVTNHPEEYLKLYRTAYENFPNDPAAAVWHWKIAFHAYMEDAPDAADRIRAQLREYPSAAPTGAALYFLGRHAERHRDFAYARAAYERLVRAMPNSFYAMQAQDRLREPDIAGAGASPDAAQFLDTLALPSPAPLPAAPAPATSVRIERSRLLREAGLPDLADDELRFGIRTDGQPALLGIEMAEQAEAPYQALRAMKATAGDYLIRPLEDAPRRFWEMLYPLPWRDDLEAGARAQNLDPFLLAGLIRQESEFNPEARSRADARGLTQVQPATARGVAQRAGVPQFTPEQLYDPAVSLKIGAAVLKGMLDAHGENVPQTLAAYNAGPNRLAQWLAWGIRYREPAEFIESIPFTETRDYVQAVMRNAEMYRRLYR